MPPPQAALALPSHPSQPSSLGLGKSHTLCGSWEAKVAGPQWAEDSPMHSFTDATPCALLPWGPVRLRFP